MMYISHDLSYFIYHAEINQSSLCLSIWRLLIDYGKTRKTKITSCCCIKKTVSKIDLMYSLQIEMKAKRNACHINIILILT